MTVANPNETIEPRDGFEALTDTTRYMTDLMPRREVIDAVHTMNPQRILDAVNGITVGPTLTTVESHLATTVDHYRQMMHGGSVGAVALLEGLRQEVLDCGVFIGDPRPDSYYAAS